MAGVQADNPKRFIGLGTVPMQAPDLAIKEMERCVKQLGLKGIEIGSNINQMNLDDPSLYPFWEAAQDLQVPIMVHPWQMMGEEYMKKYFMPWLVGMPAETTRAVCAMIFGGIFDKFPKLKVLFTHGGGSFVFTLGRIDHGFECRPDLCQVNISKKPSEYLKNFWVDSITHDEGALKYLVDHIGHERIAYGTDYPFPLGDLKHGAMLAEAQSLTEMQKVHIFWKTAFKFFNLQPAEYMTSFS
jgi:aminocarboxymuconate-semialdehyde decarboxylase